MRRPESSFAVSADCYSLAVRIGTIHARHEREMLTMVLCDPTPGVRVAKQHRVTDALFVQPDYLIIWQACVWASERNYAAPLAVGRARFKLDGHGEWTPRKLVKLATEYAPPGPCRVQAFDISRSAKLLKECHGALVSIDRNTRETLRRCVRVFERRVA